MAYIRKRMGFTEPKEACKVFNLPSNIVPSVLHIDLLLFDCCILCYKGHVKEYKRDTSVDTVYGYFHKGTPSQISIIPVIYSGLDL